VPDPQRWRRTIEGLLGVPATEGNRVEVLRDGVEIFPAMLDAIAGAERTVDLLTFVYWRGDIASRFARTLTQRARDGVRCRVVLDAVGARHVDRDLIETMEDAGVLVHWFRPLLDEGDLRNPGHRTHRKVLVVDELVGFAGGVGIAEEWDGSSDDGTGWRETQLRVRGPVVDGLRAAFADDWLDSGHPLLDHRDRFPEADAGGDTTAMVIRGESEHGWSDIALLRRVLFELAEKRIRITTPYLAPDDGTLAALVAAAERGVTVEVLVPGPTNDKLVARLAAERRYDVLLDAGVALHHFTPTMLHAKVLTVDEVVGVVGSANLNHRSLALDEEVDVVLFDHDVVARLDGDTDDDLARAEPITDGTWRRERSGGRAPLRGLTALVDRWT
jgi:cardiolipin synthase